MVIAGATMENRRFSRFLLPEGTHCHRTHGGLGSWVGRYAKRIDRQIRDGLQAERIGSGSEMVSGTTSTLEKNRFATMRSFTVEENLKFL
jgi:hypothetical protein